MESRRKQSLKENPCSLSDTFKIEKFTEIKEALKLNPIERPDLKRLIKTYAAKIQFVEFESKGLDIRHITLKFPTNALPINDSSIRNLLLAD